jgi:hypothetical protein
MSGDVERLAEWLYERERSNFYPGRVSFDEATWRKPDGTSLGARNTCLSLAADILASDWLAERDQRMQAAGAVLKVIAHGPEHPDMETYARIHNEGWDAAMLAQVAPDPTTADDWLAAHDAEVVAQALKESLLTIVADYTSNSIPEPPSTPDPGKNPTKPRVI